MNVLPISVLILALFSSVFVTACSKSEAREQEGRPDEHHKIVVTTPVAKDVVSTQHYVCQIHSRRHIEVRALETGYLEEIHVREGQAVKQGAVMFKIVPVLYQAKLNSQVAAAERAQINYDNTQILTNKSVVSNQELALAKAELSRAQAEVELARAELNFTSVKAAFDGIVDRQREQQGSLVEEGDILSTLSDNQVMWVYFNVPEARYLEYKADLNQEKDGLEIELQLANGKVSTTRPATSRSARIFRTRMVCCAMVRPATS
jgi:membrane fusion protein (multidrug efflux system)